MGGSPGLSDLPNMSSLLFPLKKSLIEQLPKPHVLSVCGNTNKSLPLLSQTGADAISVDQLTDLDEARKILDQTLLFGNIDPVATLWQGSEAEIKEPFPVQKASVDAVWLSCDLVRRVQWRISALLTA
jgi:uroporphyrinogen-III decarboxylase